MSQDKLKAIISAEIDNSIGFLETETTQQLREAIDAYLRRPYGNEVEGKSSIVTGEVAEAVDGALPSLVRIFSSSDEVVRFDPRGPQDEAGARQSTEYVNWVFMRDNDGIIILQEATWGMGSVFSNPMMCRSINVWLSFVLVLACTRAVVPSARR